MANRIINRRLLVCGVRSARLFQSQSVKPSFNRRYATAAVSVVSAVAGYLTYKSVAVQAKGARDDTANQAKKPTTNQREMTFLNFASLEYDGNVYMTPEDFLSSIMEDKPRPRTARRHLRQNEVEKLLKSTPSKSKGSSSFFRDLRDKGLISYTEYLFLLCVLTKPTSGFQIAFNMFDTDGDQRVDKKEFLVLESLMTNASGTSRRSEAVEATDDGSVVDVPNDTTLTVHFFGMKGKDVLTFQDFHKFMDSLQTEVLELEFNEFSHGMPSIHEQDFARILLRYTILTPQAHDEYLDRLASRVPHSQGITFHDFKKFCQFLNNVDDFALAMRIYTYADQPISEADFQRAVKACTGQNLNSHLIHVVFQLFDTDGDGKLSHKEFVAVMKERLHRRTRQYGQHSRWDSYKACVKTEMRRNA